MLYFPLVVGLVFSLFSLSIPTFPWKAFVGAQQWHQVNMPASFNPHQFLELCSRAPFWFPPCCLPSYTFLPLAIQGRHSSLWTYLFPLWVKIITHMHLLSYLQFCISKCLLGCLHMANLTEAQTNCLKQKSSQIHTMCSSSMTRTTIFLSPGSHRASSILS